MNGPVANALGHSAGLAEHYIAFREAAHTALGEHLTAQVRHAVAQVHGLKVAPGDEALPKTSPASSDDEAMRVCLDYARRIPFEHTAISDEEAADVMAAIGEERYVAFSVVAALADAECRAQLVDLPSLAR